MVDLYNKSILYFLFFLLAPESPCPGTIYTSDPPDNPSSPFFYFIYILQAKPESLMNRSKRHLAIFHHIHHLPCRPLLYHTNPQTRVSITGHQTVQGMTTGDIEI